MISLEIVLESWAREIEKLVAVRWGVRQVVVVVVLLLHSALGVVLEQSDGGRLLITHFQPSWPCWMMVLKGGLLGRFHGCAHVHLIMALVAWASVQGLPVLLLNRLLVHSIEGLEPIFILNSLSTLVVIMLIVAFFCDYLFLNLHFCTHFIILRRNAESVDSILVLSSAITALHVR